jgi:hypothetical protein
MPAMKLVVRNFMWSGACFLRPFSTMSSSLVMYSDASFCCQTSNSSRRQLDASTSGLGSKQRFWERSRYLRESGSG